MRPLRILAAGATLGLLLGLYLVLAPEALGPVEPWTPPAPPPLTGLLAINTRLHAARVVGKGQLSGPESVEVDARGLLYTGLADGRLVRVDPATDRVELVTRTGTAGPECGQPEAEERCGRVLGVRLGADGTIYAADAFLGLHAVEPGGAKRLLSREAGGLRYGFTDDLDLARDGTVYFTDASSRYSRPNYRKDILENSPWGRLLRQRPGEAAEVLLGGLYFANGVSLDPEERSVLFTETSRYRVRRYWLDGQKQGQVEIFADNLPGFPDNIRRAPGGGYWVALGARRSRVLDFLHPRPLVKRAFAKLVPLDFFQEHFVPRVGLALKLDEGGNVTETLWDPTAERTWSLSEAHQVAGRLYLGSISADRIAVLELFAPEVEREAR